MIAVSLEMSDEPEFRYKNKLTTESCFHLHKILDSVKNSDGVFLFFLFRFQELSVKFHFSSLYFKNFLGRKNFFVFTDIF